MPNHNRWGFRGDHERSNGSDCVIYQNAVCSCEPSDTILLSARVLLLIFTRMSAVVSKSNPSPIAGANLRDQALSVEQLRRKIAAASASGAVAPAALLAEFARTQKAYLDQKIEVEKRKRLGEVPAPELPPASSAQAPSVVSDEEKPEVAVPSPVPLGATPEDTISKSIPAAAGMSSRKPGSRWIWWLLLAAAASCVAWLWSR
jgi:hypothetical protein